MNGSRETGEHAISDWTRPDQEAATNEYGVPGNRTPLEPRRGRRLLTTGTRLWLLWVMPGLFLGWRSPVLGQAPAWQCHVPPALVGPLDEELPPFARIDYAVACSGADDRVAVAWVRQVDQDRVRWDRAARAWRVEGSDVTVRPSEPDGFPDPAPRDRDFFGPGQLVGAAVLAPKGPEWSGFLPEVGGEDLDYANLGGLVSTGTAWQAFFPLRSTTPPAPGGTYGIAVAELDPSGWRVPRVVLPRLMSYGPVWAFTTGTSTELFWLELFHRRADLPDFMGGRTRLRLNHANFSPGQTATARVAYEYENSKSFVDMQHDLVHVGKKRYDLFFTRHKMRDSSHTVRVMHVSDLLSGNKSVARQIAECGGSRLIVLALPGERVQLAWMEGTDADASRAQRPLVRLWEMHMDGNKWSPARVVFQASDWDHRSLAAAVVRSAGREAVLAVWRNSAGYMIHSLCTAPSEWSAPVQEKLAIGEPNILAACQRGAALVTHVDRNLYWCIVEVQAVSANGKSP